MIGGEIMQRILLFALIPVLFCSCTQQIDMDNIYARVFFDDHNLRKAYGPGKCYIYIIKENQIFALVQEAPHKWGENTKMYYCPCLSAHIMTQIDLCNSIKPDVKSTLTPDMVIPYGIRFIPHSHKRISIYWLNYSGRDDRIRSAFASLQENVIIESYRTSIIPDYVINNDEISRILFIPAKYRSDK